MMRQLHLFESRSAVISVSIPGGQHYVAADVLLAHLAHALRGVTLPGGQSEIVLDGDGCVFVDERLVYEPPRVRSPQYDFLRPGQTVHGDISSASSGPVPGASIGIQQDRAAEAPGPPFHLFE